LENPFLAHVALFVGAQFLSNVLFSNPTSELHSKKPWLKVQVPLAELCSEFRPFVLILQQEVYLIGIQKTKG